MPTLLTPDIQDAALNAVRARMERAPTQQGVQSIAKRFAAELATLVHLAESGSLEGAEEGFLNAATKRTLLQSVAANGNGAAQDFRAECEALMRSMNVIRHELKYQRPESTEPLDEETDAEKLIIKDEPPIAPESAPEAENPDDRIVLGEEPQDPESIR